MTSSQPPIDTPIVTVLRCDAVPEPDRTRHGDTHIRMLRHLATAADIAGLTLDLRSVDAVGGALPSDDDPSALYVTTGSATDPDSTAPWVVALRDWMRQAQLQGRPIYGVCFGHQLLAHALGGDTARHPQGWEVGLVATQKRFALPSGGAGLARSRPAPLAVIETPTKTDVQLLMSHQDVVTSRPQRAIPWLVGRFCAEQGYVIPGRAVTVQGHPEFEADQVSDIYRRRRNQLGDDVTDEAIASTTARNDGVALTVEVLRYFLG